MNEPKQDNKYKIIIADDNSNICQVVGALLNRKGYLIETVKNGYELLAYLKQKTTDIVILDLIMPEKNGTEILSAIRCLAPNIKIIIYTGFEEYEHSVYAGMADKLLLKSSDPEKLLMIIEELMQ